MTHGPPWGDDEGRPGYWPGVTQGPLRGSTPAQPSRSLLIGAGR